MRNLLLILVLANVLYFVWGMLSGKDAEPGVVIVEEGQLGSPLKVKDNADAENIASVGAVLGSGEPSALAAVVGRSCATIGPFRDSGEADTALTQYAAEGMRTNLRSTQGQIFVGHWVQIRGIPDRATANGMLEKLKEGGLADAYLIDLPRMREGQIFYVDIGLPPGKGAGAMIEKYGAEKVLLRDAATCP